MTNPIKKGLAAWLKKEGISKTETPKTVAPAAAKKQSTPKPASAARAKSDAKPRPPRRNGGKPSGRRSGGGRGSFSAGTSKHDPLHEKHTHEKRDRQHPVNRNSANVGDIRVVPLGGMEQVGLNTMFIEAGDDIIVIDTGLLFPDPEHLGIDLFIPNYKYLVQNKHKIRGVIYTHGHLDHIGAAPHTLAELGFPTCFATRLTKELILANSDEYGINSKLKITEVTPQSKVKLGKFNVEFFHVNHSIPDGVGIVVNTPYGSIVHTSDFKIDHNPSDDQPSDLLRIAEIGMKGVALGMVDSTNAGKEGHTKSEHFIEAQLAKLIHETTGRMILTTFASTIGRIAKIIEAAEAAGRTVFLSGRSMEKNVLIARKLNYLKCKDRTVQRMSRSVNKMDPNKVLILCTGSQGEELAALTRMSDGRHKDVKLTKDDTILFSSSPIPGNEMAIVKVKNNLAEIGLTTIDHQDSEVYVSGHGYAAECRTMTALLNPKYFAPIHGELYMRHAHRDMIVRDLGYKPERTFIMKNGQGIILNNKGARMMTEKEAIPCEPIMVELGRRVHPTTLIERQEMGEGGLTCIVVAHSKGKISKLEIRMRGYMKLKKDSKKMQELERVARETFEKYYDPDRPTKGVADLMVKKAQSVLGQRFKEHPPVEVIIL